MSRAAPAAETSRRRLVALAATVAAIALGLASRRWPDALPAVLGKYPGDALWALMVFFAWRALRPRAPPRAVVVLAAITSAVGECAKRWQAPWLVAFRHTSPGHLLPDHVFSWRNLVAYGVGVIVGAALDRRLLRTTAA